MTPYEQAKALYAGRPDMNMEQDMLLHAKCGGYVIATPEFFVMARPFIKTWSTQRLGTDYGDWSTMIENATAPRSHADCWFVWLLCGSLKEAVKHLPYRLPWVGFAQRGQPARFIDLEKALVKIG